MKKSFQDIVPSEKRSIRDIPLPRKSERSEKYENNKTTNDVVSFDLKGKKPIPDDLEQEYDTAPPISRHNLSSPVRKKRFGVWLIAILAVIALSISITWLLTKTTLVLTVKNISIPVDGVFVAGTSLSDGVNFTFDTIELTTDLSKTVNATGTKEVVVKATGSIVVYNNFSATPQPLIAGTRFEDQNGLIFKLNSPVTVPGKKIVAGKSEPGSVEVKVTAENAGEKYNIPLSDFTIPGFKGTPKFNGFYARSKMAMSGGIIGTVAVVSNDLLKQTRDDLQKELVISATEKLKAEIPKDFIFIDGGYKQTFKSFEPISNGSNQATVKEEVTIKGYIFKQVDFVNAMAIETKTEIVKGAPLNLDLSGIKILSIEENTPKGFFKLEGTLKGEYIVDEKSLKMALKGQKKKDVPKLLSPFPIIEKARVIVNPFWVRSLSSIENKIFIENESKKSQ